jgi:Spx/MgsR family transcriptional regulator
MIKIYGIKNCDTVKKARRWLETNKIDHEYHDFREDGLTKAEIKGWVDSLGWENLVNKRSTSWKALSETQKDLLNDKTVVDIILESPTLIKRPLLLNGQTVSVGFKAETFQKQLLNK